MSYTRLEVLCETTFAVEQFRTSSCILHVSQQRNDPIYRMFHGKYHNILVDLFHVKHYLVFLFQFITKCFT